MSSKPASKGHNHAFDTAGQLLSLEPRMLFDGAALATADAGLIDGEANGAFAHELPDSIQTLDAVALNHAPTARGEQRALLVIDSSVQDWTTIAENAASDVRVLVLDAETDGLEQLVSAVSGQDAVSSLHIVSHGSEGQISLGRDVVSLETIEQTRELLATLGGGLTAGADILLYGCDVGANEQGLAFMRALADVTGADVAASDDLTGHASLGGDWALEKSIGSIEAEIALALSGQQVWQAILAPAPTVTLSAPTDSVLIGGDFTVEAVFDNTDIADTGYAPYLDVFVPVQGADGAPNPDGLDITNATYLGAALTQTEIVLTAADISNGTVEHPYYEDNAGNRLVSIPAGFAAGDKLVVFELPFGSYTAGQPAAPIQLSGSVSDLADLNTALNLTVRAGFRFGGDALDNPSTDPSILGAETSIAISPALYSLSTSYIGDENETASGPNYLRAYRIDVDVADGQTLTDLDMRSLLPDGMTFEAISGVPATIGGQDFGASPSGSWVNVNGVLVSAAASDTGTPAGTRDPVSRTIASITGGAGDSDASMVVQFYVPEFFDDGSTPVLDPVSGDSATLTHSTSMTANWQPVDGRDALTPIAETNPGSHVLQVEALALQKSGQIDGDVGVAGLSPGDRLRYTLNLQLSDYFAVGGNSSASGSSDELLITDTLSDGLTLLDAGTSPASIDPTFVVSRADGTTDSYTLTRGVNYTVTVLADGQEEVVFNLRSTIATGNGQIMVGDLFDADNTQSRATTAQLQFDARVLETYRVGPPDETGALQPSSTQGNLNEDDYVVNNATVQMSVLDAALDPDAVGIQSESADSRQTDQIEHNAVGIAIVGRNGVAVVNDPISPIRIAPGDAVTYRVTYTVPSGDFENFSLQTYLPLPIFDAADPDADGTPSGWAPAAAFSANPAVGEYTVNATGGDGLGLATPPPPSVAANGLVFDLGDREDLSNEPLDIEVYFTVRASNDPFADGLFLSALAQQNGASTSNMPIATQSLDRLLLTEPNVEIVKGAVQDDVIEATSIYDPAYVGASPTGLFRAADDTNANPLTGTISDATVSGLDANIEQVDAGDRVRFALAVTNTGSSAAGAFDVQFSDTLPANIDPASVSNLRVVRGDGTVLNVTSDLRAAGGAALASEADAIAALLGGGLELIDPEESVAGAGGALLGTFDAAGNPTNPGENVLIVTYDATVLADAVTGATEESTATLSHYAGAEAGPDHTTENEIDLASVATPLPGISKTIVGTDQAFTPDNNGADPYTGDVAIGEVITYQVVVQVPEGTTTSAVFRDRLDANRLAFAQLVSATPSAGVSFDSGAVFVSETPSDNGGGTDNQLNFNMGTVTNANSDNANADTITFVYRALVLNTSTNNAGDPANNNAALIHSGQNVFDTAPNMRIVEPAVEVQIAADSTSIDAGDTVTYTVTVSSNGTSPAHELGLSHVIPAGMTFVPGSVTSVSGGGSPSAAGNSISANWADLAVGSSAVFTFEATVDPGVTIGQTLSSPVQVAWSSLPGASNDDHSVYVTGVADTERSGIGGINDHVDSDAAPVSVTVAAIDITRIASSEASSLAGDVVPGEVVRYRLVTSVPEASATDFQLRPSLPSGLRYVNDGSTTIAFVANGGGAGIDSSTITGTSLDQSGGGTVSADINGVTPVLALDAAAITDSGGTPVSAGAVMANGSAPVFRLGDLTNADSDADREFVVIEFNAIVDNIASNSTGQTLDAVFSVASNGTVRASAASGDIITVGEPSIVDVSKQVVDVTGDQATFEVTFTNTGNQTAHNVQLTDEFSGASNISFNQAVTVVSAPIGTADLSDADTLSLSIPSLAPTESVTVRYTATIADTDAVVPARDAIVLYTSLSGAGESLDTAVEDSAGTPSTVVTATNGERSGNTGDYGGTENDYRDDDDAAIGVISGRLWDDTLSFNDSFDAGTENPLAGVNVSLRFAGANNLFGDGDDTTASTTTDANGIYRFTAAQAGNYRVETNTSLTDAISGPVQMTVEGTAFGALDGRSEFSVTEGQDSSGHDFGFIKQNAAPTITLPATANVNEDAVLAFTGVNQVQIDDPDRAEGANPAIAPSNYRTIVSAGNGTVAVTPVGGVTVTNNGTGATTLVGSIDDINATLASLIYQGDLNYNGSDTINVRVDDRGNIGDADGDGVPTEAGDDNLTTNANIVLTIAPMPDDPVANPDTRTINEDDPATGHALDPSGAQTGLGDQADTDPDTGNGDTRTVVGVQAGTVGGPVAGSVATPVAGAYGELSVDANGQWTYTPGPAAQALRQGDTVTDVFTYTIEDSTGRPATTTITLTLNGTNDAPISQDDARTTTEDSPPLAGNAIGGNGVNGGQAGDVADSDPEGQTLTVAGVQAGATGGPVTGAVGSTIAGTYGDLVLQSDGTYSYTTNSFAQTLQAGQSVNDVFTYTVTDPDGGLSTSRITITVTGENDNITANPDLRQINEPVDANNPVLVTGNVVTAGQAGEQADIDIDLDPLTVQGVQVGNQTGPLSGSVNSALTGTWGSLTVQPNGDYIYTPGPQTNTLAAGEVVDDVFSYTISDGGSLATTTLTIRLTGENDAPLANPDTNTAPGDASQSAIGNALVAQAVTDATDDEVDRSDTLTIVGVTPGTVAGPVTGSVATPLSGTYGTLSLDANGNYQYTADNTNNDVLALRAGQSLTDVFTYTIDDGNGGQASTTITITVDGVENPPASIDRGYTISEDLVTEGGQALAFSAADFAFNDPDTGDALSSVRIESLPISGTFSLNGSPLAVGQLVPASELAQITYVPALNANNQNIGAPVQLGFRVIDSSNRASLAANTLTVDITPFNDPPVAPIVTYLVDADARSGSEQARLSGIELPTDPDRPVQDLVITVTSLPPAQNGQFELDRVPVTVGQVLTEVQLQRLHFVPAATLATALDAQGNQPAGALEYQVVDPFNEQATGTINIEVRPSNAILPPSVGLTGGRGIEATDSFGRSLIASRPPASVVLSRFESHDPIVEPGQSAQRMIKQLAGNAGGEYTTNVAVRSAVDFAPGFYLDPSQYDLAPFRDEDFDDWSPLARAAPYGQFESKLGREDDLPVNEPAIRSSQEVSKGAPNSGKGPVAVAREASLSVAADKHRRFSDALLRERHEA